MKLSEVIKEYSKKSNLSILNSKITGKLVLYPALSKCVSGNNLLKSELNSMITRLVDEFDLGECNSNKRVLLNITKNVYPPFGIYEFSEEVDNFPNSKVFVEFEQLPEECVLTCYLSGEK